MALVQIHTVTGISVDLLSLGNHIANRSRLTLVTVHRLVYYSFFYPPPHHYLLAQHGHLCCDRTNRLINEIRRNLTQVWDQVGRKKVLLDLSDLGCDLRSEENQSKACC